jgi:hypothetical protein
MAAIYLASNCHGICTKFNKNWFGNSKVHRAHYIDKQTGWRSHKPTLGKQDREYTEACFVYNRKHKPTIYFELTSVNAI